jgi:hypothetical protein
MIDLAELIQRLRADLCALMGLPNPKSGRWLET